MRLTPRGSHAAVLARLGFGEARSTAPQRRVSAIKYDDLDARHRNCGNSHEV